MSDKPKTYTKSELIEMSEPQLLEIARGTVAGFGYLGDLNRQGLMDFILMMKITKPPKDEGKGRGVVGLVLGPGIRPPVSGVGGVII